MITPETITRKEARRLVQLVEQITRCEIMARYGRFGNLEFAEYAIRGSELQEELREMLFDERNLFALGQKWGMIRERHRKPLRKRKS